MITCGGAMICMAAKHRMTSNLTVTCLSLNRPSLQLARAPSSAAISRASFYPTTLSVGCLGQVTGFFQPTRQPTPSIDRPMAPLNQPRPVRPDHHRTMPDHSESLISAVLFHWPYDRAGRGISVRSVSAGPAPPYISIQLHHDPASLVLRFLLPSSLTLY